MARRPSPSLRTWSFGFVVTLAAAFCSSPAGAAPEEPMPLDLEWIAPEGCPSRAEVLEQVARIVTAAASGERARVKARAVFSRMEDGRWHVAITTFGEGAGERSLDAASCPAASDATALVLALRIDPTIAARLERTPTTPPFPPPPIPRPDSDAPRTLSPTTPPPNPAEGPSGTPPAPTPPAAPARSSARSQLALGVSVTLGVGEMPNPDVAGELALAWGLSRLRIEVHAATGFLQNASAPGRSDVTGSTRLFTGGARGCGVLVPRRVSLAACAVGEIDWMWISGQGAHVSLDANAGWTALGGGALLTWSLGDRIALRGSLELVAPLTRPNFVIEGPTGAVTALVFQPALVAFRGALGAEVHFL
jgi:hypothetical protein